MTTFNLGKNYEVFQKNVKNLLLSLVRFQSITNLTSLAHHVMASVLNMPSQIILPCFLPASKSSGDAAAPQYDMFAGDDPLDFDLLAEYLLDDGMNTSSGSNFDFR